MDAKSKERGRDYLAADMQFGARDNARLAEGWEPHPIEFRILKGGDP
jgi:hypothetical protein